jgi:hypothetical protein
MARKEEVAGFLKDFIFKLGFWGLLIRTDRTNPKNTATLLALEFKHVQVKHILESLKPEDYSEGPLPDKLHNRSAMWVFGKIIKEREIYIKIQLGLPDSATICISFHFSDHAMDYPFKNAKDHSF